jgi:hypothetical protein
MAATWTTSAVASAFEARYAAVKLRLEAFFISSKENPKFLTFNTIETSPEWPNGNGWEATTSSEYSASYPQIKVFNKTVLDATDAWVSQGTPSPSAPEWLRIKYPEPTVINSYAITSRTGAGTVGFPTKWRMEGSHTGNTDDWEGLEAYREFTQWDANFTRTFNDNINVSSTPYLYYRLLIHSSRRNNTDPTNTFVAIGEWYLYTKAIP